MQIYMAQVYVLSKSVYWQCEKIFQVCIKDDQKQIVISANKSNDSNLQIQIDSVKGDLIAAGAVYHKVCRDRYINDRLCSEGREFVNVHEQCFMKLVDEIDTGLVYENRAYEMSQLRDMYEKILNDAYTNEVTQIQTKQECPSVEGKLPTCFDLVDCCDLDLDLDPLTFISELDLDMVEIYLHAKN